MNDPDWGTPTRPELYRGHRQITAEEAAALYPEAMVVFDWQCSHLTERGDTILCLSKRGRLSAEPPDRPYDTHAMRTIWRPEVGLWVRWSTHVSPLPDGPTQVCDTCHWEFSIWAFEKLWLLEPATSSHVLEGARWICKQRSTTCRACMRSRSRARPA